MMSLWDALRMNMMISYQELVRTFPNDIVLMPRDIVSFIETCFPVKAFDPPEELRMRFDCSLHYHHSVANDKSMVDLLSMIKELN